MDVKHASILVVDDDTTIRDFFDVMFSKLGVTVSTASDGETALSVLKEKKIDLVLLDNILPGMTGWEFVKTLKEDEQYKSQSQVAIIMLSAMGSVEDKVKGFDLGIEDYVVKPFNFTELFVRINVVLKQRATVQQLVQRERSLALIESMNNSLIYFTKHIEDPIRIINTGAERMEPGNKKSVQAYVEEVHDKSREILTALRALREKIEKLQQQREQLKLNELSVAKLERHYKKYRQYVEEMVGDGKERKD